MRGAAVHVAGTQPLECQHSFGHGACRVDEVVHQQTVVALDLTDDVDDFGDVG